MGAKEDFGDYLEARNEPDWPGPKELPAEVLARLRGRRPLWLSEAIDLMLFGSTWQSELQHIAKKRWAAAALFRQASEDTVTLYGGQHLGTDASDPIPSSYFDTPRNLGHDDNCIETDLHAADMDSFVAARKGQHVKWFNVRVDGPEFVAWIESLDPTLQPLEPAEARRVARAGSLHLLCDWYAKRVSGWPPDKRPPSESDDVTAARNKYSRVSRNLVRQARKKCAPPAWKKAGPRTAQE